MKGNMIKNIYEKCQNKVCKPVRKLFSNPVCDKCFTSFSNCWGKCNSICFGLCDKLKKNSGFRKTFWAIIFIAAFAQVFLAVSLYGFHLEKSSQKAVNPTIRAMARMIPLPKMIVGFDSVNYSRYIFERDYTDYFMRKTNQTVDDDTWIDSEINTMLAENEILKWQSYRYNIKVTKSEVSDAIAQIADENGGEDKLETALKDYYNLTTKQFRVLIKEQLMREKFDEQVISKVTARHILVAADTAASEENVAESKAKAEGYLTEINNGLDFGEAAKKYSEDTGSAENGGLLEPFSVGDMVKEFSDAAFSASPGSIVGPIRSEFGWHLIKVESKTGKIEKSFSQWLGDLKDQRIIIPVIQSMNI